jgi:homoserine trans-succinylase
MPDFFNPKYPSPERRSGLNWPRVQPGALEKPRGTFLHIGLVNDMADAAMSATQQQFHSGIEQLWEQPPEQCPDGLIVTGREPRTPDLRDEAYRLSFTGVLEWTQEHARSAVWSCLAAHAAVLALDGVERVRSRHKHFASEALIG